MLLFQDNSYFGSLIASEFETKKKVSSNNFFGTYVPFEICLIFFTDNKHPRVMSYGKKYL